MTDSRSAQSVEERDICLDAVIEGAVNFRDLGGLPADGGSVRHGIVYRSGMTHHISDAGLRRLAEEFGLRTVVDLRSPQELENGLATWQAAGITHYHLPVLRSTAASHEEIGRRFSEMASGEFDWAGMYAQMLDEGAPAFARTFELLGEEDALPVVFHCSGGRDRTGVTAALLLSTLGVPDAVIARDYARTGGYLLPHLDRFTGQWLRMNLEPDAMARMLETRDEAMVRFLEIVRGQHGSATGYLRSVGVAEGTIVSLRRRLVEAA